MTVLSLPTDLQVRLIGTGDVTAEELQDARDAYQALLGAIEKEWPPQRITEWQTSRYRAFWKFYRKRLSEIESENESARRRGVSYKERATFSKKISALQELLKETEAKGKQWARDLRSKNYRVSAKTVTNPDDYGVIHAKGFEEHLKYAMLGI